MGLEFSDLLSAHLQSLLHPIHCIHIVQVYIFPEKQSALNITIAQAPSSLTLRSKHSTAATCYSACYRDDGSLLLGCSDGVRVFREDDMSMTRWNTPDIYVTSARKKRRNIYILNENGDAVTVQMCLLA